MTKVRDLVAASVTGEGTGYAPLLEQDVVPGPSEKKKKSARFSQQISDDITYSTCAAEESSILTDVVINDNETNGLDQSIETPGEDVILVQWAAPMFFARENEKVATADVIRIGPINRPCSVRFKTVDGSAKDGVKYQACTGLLEFAVGEELKTIEIQLVEDDNFDTTLEFRIALEDPRGCILASGVSVCRTLIVDDDLFPDNKFGQQIFDDNADSLHKLGVPLLISNLKFCFLRVPSIQRKSVIMALLDQLSNLYYLLTIFLRVYLIDVVLNFKDPETEQHLWVQDSRQETAVCVALLWTLPHLVLILVGRLKVGPLFMDGPIMTHYRVNLFRKYLNYKTESREHVPVGDLVNAMGTDIKDITQKGYLSVFQLLENFGKLCCVAFFICSKNPTNAIPLLIYPVAILLIELQRRTKQLKLETDVDDVQSRVRDVLVHVASRLDLISNYKQKQFVVDEYEKQLDAEVPVKLRLRVFEFWNDQIIPLLTLLALGSYICIGSSRVLNGETTIGTFLATVNVYKDFGERFEEMYACLRTSLQAVEPLVGLTKWLNLETDVEDRKLRNRNNRKYTKEYLEEMKANGDSGSDHFDRMPIKLQDIVAPPHHCPITTELSQGSLVAVSGEHGSGKTTLMTILAGIQKAKDGCLLVPSHLRCIYVEYIPVLAYDLSLFQNLTFGTGVSDNADPDRVLRIAKRLGMSQDLLKVLERDIAKLKANNGELGGNVLRRNKSGLSDVVEDGESEENAWHKRATAFDKKRVHLARAFVYNPEIMVIARPVDDVDLQNLRKTMDLFREFVGNRGVELDEKTKWLRRPRTALFTVGESRVTYCSNIVDKVWHLREGLVEVREGEAIPVARVRLPSRSLTGKVDLGEILASSSKASLESVAENTYKSNPDTPSSTDAPGCT